MNAKKTPLETVNEQHGGKEKLVDKIVGLIGDTDGLKDRLQSASNKKLLRLLQISQTVKEKYGSPEKLAAHVANALGRAKDSDYVKKLEQYTPGKLLDLAQQLTKRAGATAGHAAKAVTETVAKTTAKAKATVDAAKKKAAPKAKKAPAKAEK
jgi:hypothetical protein